MTKSIKIVQRVIKNRYSNHSNMTTTETCKIVDITFYQNFVLIQRITGIDLSRFNVPKEYLDL